VTVGNYYEQFGSGMIFRSYEERGLGYDNAMDGVRIKYVPYKGVYLKGVLVINGISSAKARVLSAEETLNGI